MRSAKNYLIVLLAGTTLGCAILAWRQYNELIHLRAAVLDKQATVASPPAVANPTPDVASLSHESPAVEPSADAAVAPGAPASTLVSRVRPDGGPRRPNVMDDPEVQKLMAVQRKASLDARYAELFRLLKLPPDQLDRLKNLLVDQTTAIADVMAAAREQGVSGRNDPKVVQQLIAETQAEIDAGIREMLGEVGYAQFKDYEQTLPQRTVTHQLEQRLSYSSTPLSAEQSSQLIKLLSATGSSPAGNNGGRLYVSGSGNTVPVGGITDATINQALGVLAAPQIEALRELQREQQIQAELSATMRARFQRLPATPVTPASPPTGTTPGPQASGG